MSSLAFVLAVVDSDDPALRQVQLKLQVSLTFMPRLLKTGCSHLQVIHRLPMPHKNDELHHSGWNA